MEEEKIHVRTRSELAAAVSPERHHGALAESLLGGVTGALRRALADSNDQGVDNVRARACHLGSTEARAMPRSEPLAFVFEESPVVFDLARARGARGAGVSRTARVDEVRSHSARLLCNRRTVLRARPGPAEYSRRY